MQISRRLEAVAALVSSGRKMADIGTDHAYIPIYLAQRGRITHAIAMDVNRGPLTRAQEHIAQYGLGAVIETRLSDGLEALLPGEADSVVIAGMGGLLTVRILERGSEKLDGCTELILQPQSELRKVRKWLWQNGWEAVREDMVCEDGKFYPMMRAVRGGSGAGLPGSDEGDAPDDTLSARQADAAHSAGEGVRDLTELQLRYGPLLLRERHPVLQEFLLREKELNLRILASLAGQTGEAALRRAREVQNELEMIETVLAAYR